MNTPVTSTDLPSLIQLFFKYYLIDQRRLSAHTISAYRDAFRLLLPYLMKLLDKNITAIKVTDINNSNIILFLNHLENERRNCIATRNARLAAIKVFLNYAATEVPEELPSITKALLVPQKRKNRPLIECLEKDEMDAILAAPDEKNWSGRRDTLLLLVMYNTGARISEVIDIQREDLDLNRQLSVCLHGKGRKERIIPLWPKTVAMLKKWLDSEINPSGNTVFTNRFGDPLTRSGIRQRLQCAYRLAKEECPSLSRKNVTPHSIRHTTALHLLQSGVDLSVIALWLGHEKIETTHQYMEANLAMKKSALESLPPLNGTISGDYCSAPEEIMAFLDTL
jgi:integrase/recombinase XerD